MTPPVVAAIYTRVSLEDGVKVSTPRQERLCRAWVDLQGWSVGQVFEDVALSAYQPSVVRTGLEALLVEVAARRVGAVVVWRLDRLVRSPAEHERVLALCQQAGVSIRSVTEPIDSKDPMGIAVSRMFALFAGLESDVKSARLKSRFLEQAQSGAVPTQGIFGIAQDGTRIVEAEAELIREAVERVLAGEPVRLIGLDWKARGITRRDGKPFRYDGLKAMLSNPGVCGDRVFNGEVVATDCWPAIVDRLTAARVRNVLANGQRHSHSKPIRHLLAGMVTCGRCGGRMLPAYNSRRARFRCSGPLQCKNMNITESILDAWVTDQVLNRLAMRRTRTNRYVWDQRDANAAIQALNQESSALRDINRAYFVKAEITYTEWVQLRDGLALTTAQEVARAGPPQIRGLGPVPIWKARDRWDTLDLQTRRDIIGVELHVVVVNPPIHRQWHPERAVPVWVLPDPKGWTRASAPVFKASNGYGEWQRRVGPKLVRPRVKY